MGSGRSWGAAGPARGRCGRQGPWRGEGALSFILINSEVMSLRNPSHINSFFKVFIFILLVILWHRRTCDLMMQAEGRSLPAAPPNIEPCVLRHTAASHPSPVQCLCQCNPRRFLPLECSSGREKINTSIRSLHGLSAKFKYHASDGE